MLSIWVVCFSSDRGGACSRQYFHSVRRLRSAWAKLGRPAAGSVTASARGTSGRDADGAANTAVVRAATRSASRFQSTSVEAIVGPRSYGGRSARRCAATARRWPGPGRSSRHTPGRAAQARADDRRRDPLGEQRGGEVVAQDDLPGHVVRRPGERRIQHDQRFAPRFAAAQPPRHVAGLEVGAAQLRRVPTVALRRRGQVEVGPGTVVVEPGAQVQDRRRVAGGAIGSASRSSTTRTRKPQRA